MYRYFSKDASAPRTLPRDEAAPTSLDEALSRLLDLARQALDAPAAFVYFLDVAQAPRLHAVQGLALDAAPGASPFCDAVLASGGVLVIDEAKAHPALAADPLLAAAGARFCAGATANRDGQPIGVLAILDTRLRTISEAQQQTLRDLAHLVADAWTWSELGIAEREVRYLGYFEKSVEGIWCYEFVPPVPTSLPVEEQVRLAFERARLTECNDAMARMYGFENAADLADDDLIRRLPPYATGNFEAVKAFFESGYRATEVETLEYDRHGHPRHFSNNVVGIIRDGHIVRVWGSQTDITERREAEEALRQSQQLLSSINQNISEGLYRTTPRGDLLYANEALARMFGYESPEEMMKVLVPRFYHDPKRREALMDLTEREHSFKHEEVEFVRKDGSPFWGLVSCNVTLDEAGRVVTYDGAISDITQRKRYEQSLIDAREQALELARLKSTFLAHMSHEIRTPLTAMIGFADILADEASEQHRELAGLIRQSGQRLIQTLKSVLDLTRLEGEPLELAAERFDVVELAQQVLDLFRLQAQQRGLDLKLEAPPTPVIVWLDAGALSRILTNLVSNAMKFTPEGQVTVIIEEQEQALEIRVEDTGVGISEDFLPRIFAAFRQEAGGLVPDEEGSGLGLAITKRLVALLGGAIDVESKKGRGSVFTVRLPKQPLHETSTERHEAE